MRAGFSTFEITPAIGGTLNGFIARLSPSTGVDLPLYVRALLLDSDDSRCLIVGFDVLGLSSDFANRLVGILAQQIGIPAERIVLACSHTHSGPMTMPLRGLGPADESYLRFLEAQTCRAALAAAQSVQPVDVSWCMAPVDIGVNRRQILDADHKAILGTNPDGPKDHLIRVLHLQSDDWCCLLLEHACHPYCLAGEYTLISPDFWGYAAKVLREAGHDSMYLNGCAGDIAPAMAFGGPEAARRTGLLLADAVLEACANAEPESNPLLQAGSVHFRFPYDRLGPLVELEDTLQKPNRTVREEENQSAAVQGRLQSAWREWLSDLKHAVGPSGCLDALSARLSVIRIGRGAIVALPGEVFYGIGERIAGRLVADPVCMAGYCHGYIGYVPDAESFAYGGYEVEESHRYMGLWRVSPQSESILTAQVLELWQQLGGEVR